MSINSDLMNILVCPQCKGTLKLNEKEDGLICEKCRLIYEVRNGIPVMLIEEAKSF
jgi:uncharacterized protein